MIYSLSRTCALLHDYRCLEVSYERTVERREDNEDGGESVKTKEKRMIRKEVEL
jgi:hypothetical protein